MYLKLYMIPNASTEEVKLITLKRGQFNLEYNANF